jgi:hypothetical protein
MYNAISVLACLVSSVRASQFRRGAPALTSAQTTPASQRTAPHPLVNTSTEYSLARARQLDSSFRGRSHPARTLPHRLSVAHADCHDNLISQYQATAHSHTLASSTCFALSQHTTVRSTDNAQTAICRVIRCMIETQTWRAQQAQHWQDE